MRLGCMGRAGWVEHAAECGRKQSGWVGWLADWPVPNASTPTTCRSFNPMSEQDPAAVNIKH